ncbi:MAG TPA: hypothetical protein VNN22_05865 [Verrucomicrobiae bacterium]|nr:hypothetical protein [Verrucomicrobiae bacterium]
MKAFLITTGLLFGLMAVVHVWRAIEEWPHQNISLGFVLGMTALIAVPGALSAWAWWCLAKLRSDQSKRQNAQVEKNDPDDSAA